MQNTKILFTCLCRSKTLIYKSWIMQIFCLRISTWIKKNVDPNILHFSYPSKVKKTQTDKDFLNTVREYIGKEHVEDFFPWKKKLNFFLIKNIPFLTAVYSLLKYVFFFQIRKLIPLIPFWSVCKSKRSKFVQALYSNYL